MTGVQTCALPISTVLAVPAGVEVRKIDLAVEMQVLSFHVARGDVEDLTADGERVGDRAHPLGGTMDVPDAADPGDVTGLATADRTRRRAVRR